jgi:serine/threonine protein kinase
MRRSVMEAFGGNLEQELVKPDSVWYMPEPRLALLRDMAHVLAAMHESGVAHMAFKPQNIFTSGLRAVLSGFDQCIVFSDPAVRKLAVPEFDAAEIQPPELVKGAKKWDAFYPPAVDVYAFGVLLYRLFRDKPCDKECMPRCHADLVASINASVPLESAKTLILDCIKDDYRDRVKLPRILQCLASMRM